MGFLDWLLSDSDESHKSSSLFDIEDYRSVHEDRRFRRSGSGNWTDHEDWSCGEDSNTDGWDSYEDNDY